MDRQRRLMRTPLFFRRLGLVSIGYSVGKERIGAYRGGGSFAVRSDSDIRKGFQVMPISG